MKLSKGFCVGTMVGNEEYSFHVYGGRFRDFDELERRLVGVKMAAEVKHNHTISIPTRDYSIPNTEDMRDGLLQALRLALKGNDLYVGCMGGIGRTGLFIGCLIKSLQDCGGWYVLRGDNRIDLSADDDPIERTRELYHSHAVETQQQMEFVREFDTSKIVVWLDKWMSPRVVEVERTVEKLVVMTPWDWFRRLWGFDKFFGI